MERSPHRTTGVTRESGCCHGFRDGVRGGDHAVDIEYIALGLVTKVEVETNDSEYNSTVEFHRMPITGAFRLGGDVDEAFRYGVDVLVDAFVARRKGLTGARTMDPPLPV